MRVAVLALAVLAFCGAVAQAERLYVEDLPEAVTHQRSLLQASPAPTYSGTNTKATATISLLIVARRGTTLNARQYGLAHFSARILPTLRKFNSANRGANLNFRATYIRGATSIVGPRQAWLTYSFTVDLGPPNASYRAALRSELRSALRKRSLLVKVTRGNIP